MRGTQTLYVRGKPIPVERREIALRVRPPLWIERPRPMPPVVLPTAQDAHRKLKGSPWRFPAEFIPAACGGER